MSRSRKEELVAKVEYLKELEEMMEDIKAEIEGIKDEVKEEMNNEGVEELNLGRFICRWTSVISTRFDTKKFKENLGEELYKVYTKEVASKRWSITA